MRELSLLHSLTRNPWYRISLPLLILSFFFLLNLLQLRIFWLWPDSLSSPQSLHFSFQQRPRRCGTASRSNWWWWRLRPPLEPELHTAELLLLGRPLGRRERHRVRPELQRVPPAVPHGHLQLWWWRRGQLTLTPAAAAGAVRLQDVHLLQYQQQQPGGEDVDQCDAIGRRAADNDH